MAELGGTLWGIGLFYSSALAVPVRWLFRSWLGITKHTRYREAVRRIEFRKHIFKI